MKWRKKSMWTYWLKKEHDTGTLVDVLLVGKYLERICDHCVNIGKWVLYQKSGIFEEIE